MSVMSDISDGSTIGAADFSANMEQQHNSSSDIAKSFNAVSQYDNRDLDGHFDAISTMNTKEIKLSPSSLADYLVKNDDSYTSTKAICPDRDVETQSTAYGCFHHSPNLLYKKSNRYMNFVINVDDFILKYLL